MDKRPPLEEMDLRQLQEERSKLGKVVESDGYQWLVALMENQIQARFQELINPLKGMDEVLHEQYLKGELSGIQTVRLMIPTYLEDVNSRITGKEEELKDHEASSTRE